MAIKVSGTEVIDSSRNVVNVGTVDGRDVSADGTKLDGIEAGATADQTGAEIKSLYEAEADTNAYTDAEKSKLAGIETGADVTDTANVTAAGALMDSEVTNLAAVKAFDPTDYATAAQGALADSATQPGDNISTLTNDSGFTTNTGTVTSVAATVPTGFTVSGSPVTTSGTIAVSYDTGYQGYTSAEASKLAGIEAGATADQTASEIKTAYESNADTNAFTDAEQTKLAGIEAGADVTDAGNVNPLVDAHLNYSSATTGQVLSYNGSDYDWITVSGYTDGDVDTHLNTSTASSGEVLSWTGSDYDWVAVSGGATDIDGLSDGYCDQPTSGTTGSVGLGAGALANDDGFNRNVAVGVDAANDVTSAQYTVALGWRAGEKITTGVRNVAIGYATLSPATATTGSNNMALGDIAGNGVTTGSNNVFMGSSAGGSVTTGLNNVYVGKSAGSGSVFSTTGSNQIVIGYQADASSATVSNEITLGNSSIATLRCQVTTITSLSDARDKTDIQPLNAGLEFVEALNPVSFTWNMRDGGKVGQADTGFVAQDLQAAQADTGVTIPGLVFDENPDKLEAGYGKLIPVLVQAIKDLSAEVKDLKAQLEAK